MTRSLIEKIELFPQFLRGLTNDAVWLPDQSGDDNCREWERILTTSRDSISIGSMRVTRAAIDVVREKSAKPWWSTLFRRGRDDHSDHAFAIPDGSTGARVQPRRRDAILVVVSDAGELNVEVLRKHWAFAERFEQLGPTLWLVVGVELSRDGKIGNPKANRAVIETAEAIGRSNLPAPDVVPHAPALPVWETASQSHPVDASPVDAVPRTAERAALQTPAAPSDAPGELQSRDVRVFVSSTFRDMKGERNHLMANVFPMLRKLCEQRGLTWTVVDFRWGITSKEMDEKQVLPICLQEVARCDFFIGLLGERYGWIPQAADTPRQLLEKQPWLKAYRQRSLTEMEIAYAALHASPAAKHAFFYFRDPTHVARLPADADPGDFHSESPAETEELHRLKAEIEQANARGACRLRREPYRDVEELGAWVLEDFRTLVEELYPEGDGDEEIERDIDVHLAQAASRSTVYVDRQADFARLDRHVSGTDPPLVVLGESGMGKSALLANYFLRRRSEHPNEFYLIHFIGCTTDSSDEVALMRRVMLELKHHFELPDDVPVMPDQIRDGFRKWLTLSAARGRMVLMLDGLNQLNDHGRTLDLDWLPSDLPQDCRIILSTLPGPPLDAMRRRNCPEMTVEPLNPTEREQLLHDYLREDARDLDEWAIETIKKAEQTANPLYLRSLLDELRRSADHDALPTLIPKYLAAEDPPQLFALLLRQWRGQFGEMVVVDGLSLLWAARLGLTEQEILDLLAGDGDSTIRAAWSQFYFATESIFVQRDGLLGFSHDYIRAAVEQEFLREAENRRECHRRLAEYFARRLGHYLTDRIMDELAWQYRHQGDWRSLKELLTNREVFVRLRSTERGKSDLQSYWLSLATKYDTCEAYAAAATKWEQYAVPEDFLEALHELGIFHFERAEYATAEVLMWRALGIWEQSYGANHPNVATALSTLAQLLKATNRLAEAEPLIRRALAIREQSYGVDHRDVATALNDLAKLLMTTNRTSQAEPLIRRAVTIYEQSFGADHPDIATALSTLAELLHHTNRLAEAEPLIRRALIIREQSYGVDHPNVATALNQLAHLLQHTSQLVEAEPLMRRALAIDEKFYGRDHPKVATALNHLAQILEAANRLAEAEPLMRRALAIDESYGAEHYHVARDLNNLAALLQATNRLAEAEPLYRRALFVYEQSYGTKHPDVATGLNNLALLLQAANRLAEAEPLMRRMVEIFLNFTQVTGHPHPYLQRALGNYGGLLQTMGTGEQEIHQRIIALHAEYGLSFSLSTWLALRSQPP